MHLPSVIVLMFLSLVTAMAEDLPKPQVPDPFGLGERLALVDYLRDTCKLTPPPDATMEQLVALYWKHHSKERDAIKEDATDQALAADRMRRLRAELKDRFKIDAPADADESTLGRMLADARSKATSTAVQQVLDKAAARDNPATPEEAARYADQDRESARVRMGLLEQDEKSARAEMARIDEQRAALEKQGREQIAQLEKLRDAHDAAVTKHNQLVTLYQQKTNEGSTDAIAIFDQINAQRKVVSEAKTAIDLKSSEIEALGRQDEALATRRKRYEDALTDFQRRREDERRKMGASGAPAGGTPGGVSQAPAAGTQQARLVAGVMLLVVDESSTGTGFVVSRDGLVVTNAHVVKNRTASVVAMWDSGASRKPVRMRVVDLAEADDLALLKADSGAPFEALKLDEVYELQRPLVAAGFPLAGSVAKTLQTSPSDIVVSRGILGAVRRNGNRVEWLQHDCRIASGNSGGPLIDQQTGAVIGVNTMVLETDGVKSHGDGINLAIPIRKVMDRFAAHLKP